MDEGYGDAWRAGYVPGADWLLLRVKPVTDWLFTAGVEQQAEEYEKDGSTIKKFCTAPNLAFRPYIGIYIKAIYRQ